MAQRVIILEQALCQEPRLCGRPLEAPVFLSSFSKRWASAAVLGVGRLHTGAGADMGRTLEYIRTALSGCPSDPRVG
jgi:hypothetical protein